MKLIVLVLRDIKADMHLAPIYVPNLGAALRDLGDQVNNPQSQEAYCRHPADFELYELGTFETETGEHQLTERKQLMVLTSLLNTKQ